MRNRNKNTKIANGIILVLVISLIAVLFIGYTKDKVRQAILEEKKAKIEEKERLEYEQKQEEEKELQRQELEKQREEEDRQREELENQKEVERVNNLTAYERIKEGKECNVLIIGDSLTYGLRTDGTQNIWYEEVAKMVNEQYNANLNFTIIENSTDTLEGVYRDFISYEDKYHMAIIGLGGSPNETIEVIKFADLYETMINKIKEDNPSCSIINISHVLRSGDTQYCKTIRELSNKYNLQIADIGQVFYDLKMDYNQLISEDGIYPTDLGYSYYIETFKKIINENLVYNYSK